MYKFPTSNRRRASIKPLPIARQAPPEPEVIGTIQGQVPGSREEWRVAVALYKLGYTFEYQKPVLGGRISGGQVIDFWVTSTHLPTPIYLNGIAWHNNINRAADEYKMSQLKKVYHGMIRPIVVIWDYEVPTINTAMNVLRRKM